MNTRCWQLWRLKKLSFDIHVMYLDARCSAVSQSKLRILEVE
jgi:hypothetical protein